MRIRETRGVCRCGRKECDKPTRLFALELFADTDKDIKLLEAIEGIILEEKSSGEPLILIGEPTPTQLAKAAAAPNN